MASFLQNKNTTVAKEVSKERRDEAIASTIRTVAGTENFFSRYYEKKVGGTPTDPNNIDTVDRGVSHKRKNDTIMEALRKVRKPDNRLVSDSYDDKEVRNLYKDAFLKCIDLEMMVHFRIYDAFPDSSWDENSSVGSREPDNSGDGDGKLPANDREPVNRAFWYTSMK